MNKPTKPCYNCGSNEWWRRPDGSWNCGQCHPNPNPEEGKSDEPEMVAVATFTGESHVEPVSPARAGPNPVEKSPSLEVIALMERVKKGNDKLWNAWKVIRDIEDPEEKEELFRKWHEKKDLLEFFCKELVTRGFKDCLYIENGKKTRGCLYNPDNPEWFCNTCPAAMGGGPEYWVKEMEFKG